MKLYSYFRSSAANRVRIALNLKNLSCDIVPVHLLRQGGEQLSDDYRKLNPAALVPVLIDEEDGGNAVLTQSLAIIENHKKKQHQPQKQPTKAQDRAHVRSIAQSIACDIHPL